MISTPDELAAATRDLALAALHEVTPASTVGPSAGYTAEDDGVVSLRFENRLPGYPGWYWTVSVAQLDDADPTVLEVELMPGDRSLLAPDWVPWAERLAEYRAHQAELAAQGADEDEHDDESDGDEGALDDVDDLAAADFDDDGSPHLHGGDLDGVDIDELDEDADDSDDSDDESDDEPNDDESDEDSDEHAQDRASDTES
ncbi:DUF3027 domain-containing protein [Microbacterium sp. Mu-80]|uniref:DUF3027 domain-containing protein n=1 Tax=Microbacterium bandirmense TaxID=3122050 RepID=A0ABU8LC82_9MICO